MRRTLALVVVLLVGHLFHGVPASALECTFTNPLRLQGQDPSVVYHDGMYYLVQSSATGLTIAASPTLTELGSADPVLVYAPPPGEPYSYDLWAPELQWVEGEWYIYVAATEAPGLNATHRMYVLQADTDNPQGSWTMRGQVSDPVGHWAIDGAVFEWEDQLYMVWSGWPDEDEMTGDFPQNLYIAPMSDPLTISGEGQLIATPDQPWERSVQPLLEGPQPFISPTFQNGEARLNIVYSADASWMPAYKLGLLTLVGDDPLNPQDWQKADEPIFQQVDDAETPVYGPGHNSSPVPSPDGTEWWFLYHAKNSADPGWSDRNIRLQEFTWSDDGQPILDAPIPVSEALPRPAGEPCGLVAAVENVAVEGEPVEADQGVFFNLGMGVLNTQGSYTVAAEVQLADTTGPYAFVSQEGGFNSNFILGYADGRFTFTLQDAFGQNPVQGNSVMTPQIAQWYDVAGVYDARADQLLLYVDGVLQDQETFTTPWQSLGGTLVGAARRASQRVDVFNGQVRDVQLFNGALDAAEIVALTP